MASAQLMEEELQHSVMVSEGEHDIIDSVDVADGRIANDLAFDSNLQINVDPGVPDVDDGDFEEDDEKDDERARLNGQGIEEDPEGSSEDSDDDDAEGEDDDDVFEDDLEGDDEEEEDNPATSLPKPRRRMATADEEDEQEEFEDEEGVGAVKVKPGETEDELSEGSASPHFESGSDISSEGGAAWEDAAENRDDEDEDDESTHPNGCMFCKQDEEHDPGEDFETYLTCAACGEGSHQQCAREASALLSGQRIEEWKCPDCADEEDDDDDDEDAQSTESVEAELNGITDADASPATRRATAPKLARDLLPSQKIKPDSHSVFNQLVLDEDPMDGSRVLRKRKTSSVEPDDSIISLRKRRKNTSDGPSIDGANITDDNSRPHSARSLRLKVPQQPAASIVKNSRNKLIVEMHVNSSELRQILSRRPRGGSEKKSRGGARTSQRGSSRAMIDPSTIPAPFVASSFSQPFYSFFDKDADELKGKPYGGILSEAEADTSKTLPTNDDRRRFDEAKQKAEEEWRQRLLAMQAEIEVPVRKQKKNAGPASQIECIQFGGWEIDTWYAAPYPEEYSRNRVLYICEFCLKYMNSDYVAWRHKLKCPAKHPPGDEIYRQGSISMFEVDGRKNPVYCQNLCLLAKLFLGSKTLYYDVEPFLFYVLCEYDDMGYHFVGYFSKEKRASSQNNVSCILTLPIHQRKGYGNLLIDFSYLLTRIEEKTGSPEKPLSDMGLVSYRNYWRLVMCQYLSDYLSGEKSDKPGLSIKQISDDTGMTPDDVISALEGLRCLVRDPQTHLYAFRVDLKFCQEHIAKWEAKKYVKLDPKALTWTPYVMGRGNATNFELGPAISAIAPREEDEEPKISIPSNVPVSLANGTPVVHAPTLDGEEIKLAAPGSILESTEPNDTEEAGEGEGEEEAGESNNVNGNGVTQSEHDLAEDSARDDVTVGERQTEEDWAGAYRDIPPTRFEVFPPLNARRNDRARATTIGRPPVVRTASSVSRPRPRRSLGGRKSSSTSKPKSGSKRKTGGTGRGPGRWPKGTKKSDYGNADSGPGLPPAWVAERNRLAALAASKRVDVTGKRDGDTVQVHSPVIKESKSDRRNGFSSEGSSQKGRPSPRSQSSKENSNPEIDAEMEDVDAVGEDDE